MLYDLRSRHGVRAISESPHLRDALSGRDVYATLYAQRMFFLVTLQPRGAQFEVIPYGDARHHAEVHLGRCRRDGSDDLESWSQLFDQTFI